MIAIISDIHSNLAALEAVLADIEARKCDRILCLGDIVGYGPNPSECVDLLRRRSDVTIMGNHDEAIFQSKKTEEFNLRAEMALEWTRDALTRGPEDGVEARFAFLRAAAEHRELEVDGMAVYLVHGSPRRPLREYIFPRDVRNREKMRAIFDLFPHLCFVGHSHVPGIYSQDLLYTHPSDLEFLKIYHFEDDEKAIVNVGSVGQPRDSDPRACYVTLTEEADAVVFRRVKYDIERTREQIYAIAGLDNSLGDRLVEGR